MPASAAMTTNSFNSDFMCNTSLPAAAGLLTSLFLVYHNSGQSTISEAEVSRPAGAAPLPAAAGSPLHSPHGKRCSRLAKLPQKPGFARRNSRLLLDNPPLMWYAFPIG